MCYAQITHSSALPARRREGGRPNIKGGCYAAVMRSARRHLGGAAPLSNWGPHSSNDIPTDIRYPGSDRLCGCYAARPKEGETNGYDSLPVVAPGMPWSLHGEITARGGKEIVTEQNGDENRFITSNLALARKRTAIIRVGSTNSRFLLPTICVNTREATIANLSSAGHILRLLLACGLKQRFALAVLAAAAELLDPSTSRDEVVARAQQFFAKRAGLIPAGLNSLPVGWSNCLCTWKPGKWGLS
jgi:hypothetical protein